MFRSIPGRHLLPQAIKHRLIRSIYPHIDSPPKTIKPIEFWIDVVSGCNLRCTACPVGMPEYSNSIGRQLTEMDPELFDRICNKAKQDTGGNCRLGLYNWTEPTLHSRLDQLLAIAETHGIPCGISSNLNHNYDWSLLKPRKLANFTITVSGFTQKVYSINHRGGRIEPVLANLVKISQLLGDWESYQRIDVRYLVHRENQHEISLFKHFCEKLGLRFTPYHAYYMPIDKMFDGVDKVPDGLDYIYYTPMLVKEVIGDHRSQRCFMRETQVCLDVNGDFSVCCVESPSSPRIANYLTTDFKTMQASRYGSDLCRDCTANGINIFATYGMQEPVEIQQAIEARLPVHLADLA